MVGVCACECAHASVHAGSAGREKEEEEGCNLDLINETNGNEWRNHDGGGCGKMAWQWWKDCELEAALHFVCGPGCCCSPALTSMHACLLAPAACWRFILAHYHTKHTQIK